jgi:hypothetical protein
MIRLSLPPFDPKAGLVFDLTIRVETSSTKGNTFDPGQVIDAVTIGIFTGRCFGWAYGESELLVLPNVAGIHTLKTAVRFNSAEAAGLTGNEGWFNLMTGSGCFVFVTDCVLAYTTFGGQGSTTNQGYFV